MREPSFLGLYRNEKGLTASGCTNNNCGKLSISSGLLAVPAHYHHRHSAIMSTSTPAEVSRHEEPCSHSGQQQALLISHKFTNGITPMHLQRQRRHSCDNEAIFECGMASPSPPPSSPPPCATPQNQPNHMCGLVAANDTICQHSTSSSIIVNIRSNIIAKPHYTLIAWDPTNMSLQAAIAISCATQRHEHTTLGEASLVHIAQLHKRLFNQ